MEESIADLRFIDGMLAREDRRLIDLGYSYERRYLALKRMQDDRDKLFEKILEVMALGSKGYKLSSVDGVPYHIISPEAT